MQKFTLIWAIFILLATLYPCCLIHDCMDEVAHHLHDDDPLHEHNNEEDADHGCMPCSPFHTCQVQVKISTHDFDLLSISRIAQTLSIHFCYQLLEGYDPSASVWQPPRV